MFVCFSQMSFIEIFLLFIFCNTAVFAAPSIDNSTATTANFATVNVLPVGQTVAAVVGDTNYSNTTGIRVIDDVSSGWSATISATNLTTKGNVKKITGSNSTVNFTGTYDGLQGVISVGSAFTVEITTGGSVGVAMFKWTNPSGVETTSVITASSVLLSNGISVTFAPATYVVGDKWSIGVDVFPYTGLTISPSIIYAESGTLTGLSSGTEESLTGSSITSDPKTIMFATAGNGIGTYWQDLDLNLNVHSYPLSGNFNGIVTLTVS
jgi:hypothetical protein